MSHFQNTAAERNRSSKLKIQLNDRIRNLFAHLVDLASDNDEKVLRKLFKFDTESVAKGFHDNNE